MLPRSPHIEPSQTNAGTVGQRRNVSNAREPAAPPTPVHKRGRSIHSLTQGIINVGRGSEAKKAAAGKR